MTKKKYVRDKNGLVKATTTTELQLQKPLINENYDINIFNSNMDKIDKGIKDVKTQLEGVSTDAKSTSFDNSENGMSATNVQSAIEENKASIEDLKQNVDSAKEGIVGAIGDDEINDNSTFEEIKTHLANTKSELVNQLNDKGVTVEGDEGLLDIVDKIGDIRKGFIVTNAPDWAIGEIEAHNFSIQAENMPTGRNSLLISQSNNKIYAIGGWNDTSNASISTNECYDIATNTWETKADMPTKRCNIAGESVNNKIYVFGGRGSKVFNTNECYDTMTDTWTTKANMPHSVYYLSSARVDNKIYCVHGHDGTNGININNCYDTNTNTWTEKTGTGMYNYGASMSSIGDKIYISGGFGKKGNSGSTGVLTQNMCYDTRTDTWTTKADMPTARYIASSSVIDNIIYVVGGSNGNDKLKDIITYNSQTDQWFTIGKLSSERYDSSSVAIGNIIYTIGGTTNSINSSTLNECYIP